MKRETIKKWAWYHIEAEGGKLVTRIDDVMPNDPNSCVMLWCIDYGEFGIALVAGIDRAQKSQVTTFAEKHGDHTVQHVAYDVGDLEASLARLAGFRAHPRGEMLVRHDFGVVKQVLGKGYHEAGDPAEASFPEYVERPKRGKKPAAITFSQSAGRGFYQQIEDARAARDTETLIDFSRMPEDWEPPEPESK